MGYVSGPNDMFIRGASASGFILDSYYSNSGPSTASQISLPAPGSGLMFSTADINGNADHVNKSTIVTLTPTILAPGYGQSGLWRTKHAGYMADNTNYFDITNPIPNNNYGNSSYVDPVGGFGSQQLDIEEMYSLQWTGFFIAPATGNYNFYTISDDCSFLWLGENAKHGMFNRSNALVDNGGLHGSVSVPSNVSVALVAGQYYPIRIQFGEAGGGEACMVFYSNDAGQTKVTHLGAWSPTPILWHDPVNLDLY